MTIVTFTAYSVYAEKYYVTQFPFPGDCTGPIIAAIVVPLILVILIIIAIVIVIILLLSK